MLEVLWCVLALPCRAQLRGVTSRPFTAFLNGSLSVSLHVMSHLITNEIALCSLLSHDK